MPVVKLNDNTSILILPADHTKPKQPRLIAPKPPTTSTTKGIQNNVRLVPKIIPGSSSKTPAIAPAITSSSKGLVRILGTRGNQIIVSNIPSAVARKSTDPSKVVPQRIPAGIGGVAVSSSSSTSSLKIPASTVTSASKIPASTIDFKAEKISQSGLSVTDRGVSGDGTDAGAPLSCDLLSARLLCSSAGSYLSELTLSSAELPSGPSSPQPHEEQPPHATDCADCAISEVKLNPEDQQIVNMIELIEETKEQQTIALNKSSTETTTLLSCSSAEKSGSSGSTVVGPLLSSDLEPVTTLASTHADNWSIVKNMLLNSIRDKQVAAIYFYL